jgi:hypothetical protein
VNVGYPSDPSRPLVRGEAGFQRGAAVTVKELPGYFSSTLGRVCLSVGEDTSKRGLPRIDILVVGYPRLD